MRSDEKAAIIASLEAMMKTDYEPSDVVADLRTLAMGLLALMREDAQRSQMARGLLARFTRWGGR